MLWYVFLACATVGGTVLAFQVVTMMIGFSAEAGDLDMPDDLDGAFDADVGMDVDVDVGDSIADAHHPSPMSAFRVLSFRTVVAAMTFFGLTGLAADSAGYETPIVLGVAVAAGVAAMYLVYWMMRGMRKLQAEGTAKIGRTMGRPATVYVPIPADKAGTGKIQINLQNRTMEYLAMTPGDRLATGAKVVVTRVITSDTVEVESAPEPERSSDV
jgi:hypothetical protein